MTKTLRYLLLSIIAMLGMQAQAQVTFDFDADYATLFPDLAGVSSNNSHDGDFTEAMTATIDGVSLTISPADEGKTANRIWSGSPRLRMYSGTITISAPGHKITHLTITAGKWNDQNAADSGTLTGTSWEGEAETVVISIAANTQLKKIAVATDNGGDVVKPTEGQTPETALTVERALEIINALEDGKSTDFTYYVAGKVREITYTSKTISFTMATSAEAEAFITVYNAKGLENKDITDKNFMKAGDDVVVYGVLQKYVKSTVVTPEVTSGYVYSVNGNTKAEEVTEPTIEGGTTPETAISVSAAVTAINTMKDGQTTTASYYVSGTVRSVTEISTEKGNATFILADETGAELTIFRVKGLENKNITDAEAIKEGDAVVVYGKLKKYVKDDAVTPELTSGYIYSINGKTAEETPDPDPYTQVGSGSLENPYTVEDILHMQTPENSTAADGQAMVWVKGYIAGALNSSGSAFDPAVASNIALTADATSAEPAKTVPVQLPNGSLRAMLNVVDNPGNVGKEVAVYGHILKYMSRTGLKNTADFSMNGQQYSTDIRVITTDADQAPCYNVAGQRVSAAKKGLYIQHGKKVIR